MSEPVAEPMNLERELDHLLFKYGMDTKFSSARILARYLIRQLDNFRETLQEQDQDNRSKEPNSNGSQ